MARLQIPRLGLACILMGERDALDDDFTSSPTQPVSHTLTRLFLQLDGEPAASKFYLHGVHDETPPHPSMPPDRRCAADLRRWRARARGGGNIHIPGGRISADHVHHDRVRPARADGEKTRPSRRKTWRTASVRRLPAIETLVTVVTGMPLETAWSARCPRCATSLQSPSPVLLLAGLRNLYVRDIGADALALVRYVGQRLEPRLPDPRIVCPASLKSLLGTRFQLERSRPLRT